MSSEHTPSACHRLSLLTINLRDMVYMRQRSRRILISYYLLGFYVRLLGVVRTGWWSTCVYETRYTGLNRAILEGKSLSFLI